MLPGGGGAAAPPGATLHPAPAAPQPVPPGCIRAALLNRRNLAELFVGRSEMAALRQLELALRGESPDLGPVMLSEVRSAGWCFGVKQYQHPFPLPALTGCT